MSRFHIGQCVVQSGRFVQGGDAYALRRDVETCSLAAKMDATGVEVILVAAVAEDSAPGGAAAVIAPAMREVNQGHVLSHELIGLAGRTSQLGRTTIQSSLSARSHIGCSPPHSLRSTHGWWASAPLRPLSLFEMARALTQCHGYVSILWSGVEDSGAFPRD